MVRRSSSIGGVIRLAVHPGDGLVHDRVCQYVAVGVLYAGWWITSFPVHCSISKYVIRIYKLAWVLNSRQNLHRSL